MVQYMGCSFSQTGPQHFLVLCTPYRMELSRAEREYWVVNPARRGSHPGRREALGTRAASGAPGPLWGLLL
jgi:hypothetical protein